MSTISHTVENGPKAVVAVARCTCGWEVRAAGAPQQKSLLVKHNLYLGRRHLEHNHEDPLIRSTEHHEHWLMTEAADHLFAGTA